MTELLAASPEFLLEMTAGSVGGFCSKALDYPLDSAKTILQTQASSCPSAHQNPATAVATKATALKAPTCVQYTSTWDCLQQTVKQKGFLSLYQGIGSRLLGSMAENAVCFLAYGTIKKRLLAIKQDQANDCTDAVTLSLLDLSIAGAGSGAAVSFVMTPVELVKCRLQVSSQLPCPQYKGSWDCVRQTLQNEGLFRGLYKGHLSTMYREVPGNFCWYLTYEAACDVLAESVYHSRREQLPIQAHMAGGAAAGIMYWVAIFPVDTVKSVLQTSSTANASDGAVMIANPSFQQALQQIYQQHGLRGLYRGFAVTAMRAAPANAVLFAGYEQTVQFLKHSM